VTQEHVKLIMHIVVHGRRHDHLASREGQPGIFTRVQNPRCSALQSQSWLDAIRTPDEPQEAPALGAQGHSRQPLRVSDNLEYPTTAHASERDKSAATQETQLTPNRLVSQQHPSQVRPWGVRATQGIPDERPRCRESARVHAQ
jgi:hypothetical protein